MIKIKKFEKKNILKIKGGDGLVFSISCTSLKLTIFSIYTFATQTKRFLESKYIINYQIIELMAISSIIVFFKVINRLILSKK